MTADTELRVDALSGRYVLVATGRAARPHEFGAPAPDDPGGPERCPFCPGAESETPPETGRTGAGKPGTAGWRVRVFPNLYPITDAHEVVVLSPDHERSFGRLDDTEAVEVMTVLRDRVSTLTDSRHPVAVAILNHRRAAGASLPHPHAQVVATRFVPPAIDEALARFASARHDLVLADLAQDDGLVVSNGDASSWCPYASGAGFQLRVASRQAGASFADADAESIAAVAIATRAALARLDRALDDPPYNLVVHSAPPAGGPFHWYVEVTPRLAVVAGFEEATGVLVNSVRPEHAAGVLRGEERA